MFVILALLGLATAPTLATRRLTALQAEADATTGQAHLLSDSLKTLFVAEIILLEHIRKGEPHSGAHYRAVRASQDTVITELREIARRISTVASDRVATVADISARWHTVPDAFVASRVSDSEATGEMSRILADRDSMLFAEQQLDAYVAGLTENQRALGGEVLVAQRRVSLGLGLLAVIATITVVWFAHRERRLARALTHTLAISEQRRADLATVTETKNRLMHGFTHDVKNPIGAADGYMQLLEDGIFGPVVEKQRTSIAGARRSLQAALLLVNDLLEIAKAERGLLSLQVVPTDVRIVAREVGEQYRAQAEAKGLTIDIDTSADVPVIVSDPVRVHQVLGNLLSNAVKYTVSGAIAVRVGHEREPRTGERVSISVTDTGLGIANDQQRLLFQEFVRLDPSAGPGAGIGLAMSARIVEALRGAITVQSERGRGSVFTLWLPIGHTG